MKTTSIILLLTVMFLGLSRLTGRQKARLAERPPQMAVDLRGLAR